MLSLRRPDHDFRIEIMPLIDVIFLLLTFFIYAMVLMIRAELLPLDMQEFSSGQEAVPESAITISLDRAGDLFLDRAPVSTESLLPALQDKVKMMPDAVIYLAAEEFGDTDRLPVFLAIYDKLLYAGLDIKLVGRPKDQPVGPTP